MKIKNGMITIEAIIPQANDLWPEVKPRTIPTTYPPTITVHWMKTPVSYCQLPSLFQKINNLQ